MRVLTEEDERKRRERAAAAAAAAEPSRRGAPAANEDGDEGDGGDGRRAAEDEEEREGNEEEEGEVLASGATKLCKCQIWDTAGQEAFRSLTRSYYRGAHGVLLLFSLVERASFAHLESWVTDVRTHGEPGARILLVGSMADLVQESPARRAVSRADAIKFVKKHELVGYVETSARSGHKVTEAFASLAQKVFEQEQRALWHDKLNRGAGSKGAFRLYGSSASTSSCC